MAKRSSDKKPKARTIEIVDKEIEEARKKWCELREGIPCYLFMIPRTTIRNELVDDVFDDIRAFPKGKLDVIISSSGGSIDAAYNLALLLRRWGTERLTFIVPRWAKSAATLITCAGDQIAMTPVAELGPLDPQIMELKPIEGRIERFSPLHIDATLELIRQEFEEGNKDFASALVERLQFPLTLGSYKSSMEIGKEYVTRLLSTRMLREDKETAQTIAKTLAEGYPDHGYCIDVDEARAIGLNVMELDGKMLDVVWSIHLLTEEKHALEQAEKRKALPDRLKDLPLELLDLIPTPEPTNDVDRGVEHDD